MIGSVLSGQYEVQEVVGTGGMAVVYRAWDRKNKRTVAIKVLRPEYEQDQEFVRRFSREAEAAAHADERAAQEAARAAKRAERAAYAEKQARKRAALRALREQGRGER